MKGGKREENQGWVCEGEKRLGDREKECSLRAYSPLQCLEEKNLKKKKIRLSSEDDIGNSQDGGGGLVAPLSSSQVTVKSLRGTVYTFS